MSVESKFENKYKNYKEEFTELLDEVVEGSLPVLPEMRAELDEVYAQAAKADEYVAKAKAFDRIVKESKGTFSCGDFCDDVRHIINNYEIGVATDD